MKHRKASKRLAGRLIGWDATINDKHHRSGAPKVDARVRSGGYHKPGSWKK